MRAHRRRFLAEGPQAVGEALAAAAGAGDLVIEVFGTDECTRRHPELPTAAAAAGVSWRRVSDGALRTLAQTVTPQGVIAVCRFFDQPHAQVAESADLLVICADVRDPGNAGTVIRCADAAGADGVVLAGSSVDPYNGKAVRAGAGSLFHLPLAVGVPVPAAVSAASDAGLRVLAADGSGDVDLFEAETSGLLGGRVAWLFGNETRGLCADVAAMADAIVRVPIRGRAESLNLATAAAVCLYASARGRG